MASVNAVTRAPRAIRFWPTTVVAVVVALHGIAHFVGTTENLRRATDGRGVGYLGGAWLISSPDLLRVLAVAWAVVGVAVIVAAVLVGLRPAIARPYLAAAVTASLVLSVLGLWAAVVGVVIDLVLLALVWWAPASLFGPRRPGRGA